MGEVVYDINRHVTLISIRILSDITNALYTPSRYNDTKPRSKIKICPLVKNILIRNVNMRINSIGLNPSRITLIDIFDRMIRKMENINKARKANMLFAIKSVII